MNVEGNTDNEETEMRRNQRHGAGSSLQEREEKGSLKGTREWQRVLREGGKKLNSGSGEVGTQRTEAPQPPKGGHCSLASCHSQMAALLTQNFSLCLQGSWREAEVSCSPGPL